MKMKVYLVLDLEFGETVAVTTSMESARKKLLSHLRGQLGYLPQEWEDLAKENGLASAEELQNIMQESADFDESFGMKIEERELEN